MSAAAAAAPADAGAKPAKGKKKLVMIIVIALVVLLGGGGAAMVLLKKKPPAGEDGEEAAPEAHAKVEHKSSKIDPKHPPTFVPLDPFVVNLADKDADRYAQVGITLQVDDAKFAEEMKTFMPAIRNGILMILAHKSSKELQDRDGKEQLAGQIQREAARTMGYDIEEPDDDDAAAAAEAHKPAEADKGKKKKKKKKRQPDENPIRQVLFANFIIQ